MPSSAVNWNGKPEVSGSSVFIISCIYILSLLSNSRFDIGGCLVFGAYPLFLHIRWRIPVNELRRGIPGILLIFLFASGNIVFDRNYTGALGPLPVTGGMVSSSVIVIKGLFSLWMLLIVTYTVPFIEICKLMRRLKVPEVFIMQLLLLERYLIVLKQEALSLKRARDCRSFGKKGQQIKVAALIIGSFFLRTVERAERIHRAMVSRGFNGSLKMEPSMPLGTKDFLVIFFSAGLFLTMRVFF